MNFGRENLNIYKDGPQLQPASNTQFMPKTKGLSVDPFTLGPMACLHHGADDKLCLKDIHSIALLDLCLELASRLWWLAHLCCCGCCHCH